MFSFAVLDESVCFERTLNTQLHSQHPHLSLRFRVLVERELGQDRMHDRGSCRPAGQPAAVRAHVMVFAEEVVKGIIYREKILATLAGAYCMPESQRHQLTHSDIRYRSTMVRGSDNSRTSACE